MELINKQKFNCIVLDLGLKDISGFEILSFIRSSGLVTIPVVVYTGKDLNEEERLELMRYSESVIIKSVRSPERLLEETALFLHRVVSELPRIMQREIKMVRENNYSLKNKNVLLVDDDMRNVFALSSVLEKNGIEVIVGKNGKDAIQKLEAAANVDLILMDIMMPEMDGYEAISIIRKKPKFKHLPIIALTAKAMKGDRNKCIEAGANDYLSKPVEVDKLMSLLRVWLHD
ncbi:MAG: response regulator [Spirochaetales bacterium]|nr:response regulator [Spirochaetales bacterium]